MAKHIGTKLRAFALAAGLAGAVLTIPSTAQAEEVQPTAKGIIGGALIGGEIVVFTEALFGVHSTLPYIIGAGVGAAAGGVGGYFIEQAVDDGRIPAYMLAGGLALLIPAVVVTLDATRFRPTEGARDDKPSSDAPASDPGKPGGSSVVGAESAATTPGPGSATQPVPSTPPAESPTTPTPAPGGGGTKAPQRAPQAANTTARAPARAAVRAPSLVNLHKGTLALGMPVPEVRPILGSTERSRMGVENRGSELRFPVVNVTF